MTDMWAIVDRTTYELAQEQGIWGSIDRDAQGRNIYMIPESGILQLRGLRIYSASLVDEAAIHVTWREIFNLEPLITRDRVATTLIYEFLTAEAFVPSQYMTTRYIILEQGDIRHLHARVRNFPSERTDPDGVTLPTFIIFFQLTNIGATRIITDTIPLEDNEGIEIHAIRAENSIIIDEMPTLEMIKAILCMTFERTENASIIPCDFLTLSSLIRTMPDPAVQHEESLTLSLENLHDYERRVEENQLFAARAARSYIELQNNPPVFEANLRDRFPFQATRIIFDEHEIIMRTPATPITYHDGQGHEETGLSIVFDIIIPIGQGRDWIDNNRSIVFRRVTGIDDCPNRVIAPHVSRNHTCLGDWGQPIAAARVNGDLAYLFDLCIGFLSRGNYHDGLAGPQYEYFCPRGELRAIDNADGPERARTRRRAARGPRRQNVTPAFQRDPEPDPPLQRDPNARDPLPPAEYIYEQEGNPGTEQQVVPGIPDPPVEPVVPTEIPGTDVDEEGVTHYPILEGRVPVVLENDPRFEDDILPGEVIENDPEEDDDIHEDDVAQAMATREAAALVQRQRFELQETEERNTEVLAQRERVARALQPEFIEPTPPERIIMDDMRPLRDARVQQRLEDDNPEDEPTPPEQLDPVDPGGF